MLNKFFFTKFIKKINDTNKILHEGPDQKINLRIKSKTKSSKTWFYPIILKDKKVKKKEERENANHCPWGIG